MEETKCVYWKFSADNETKGKWKTDGCWKVEEYPNGVVHCQCNHMTNFALLLDLTQTKQNPLYLQIISYAGGGISMVAMMLTVLIYTRIAPTHRGKDLHAVIMVRLCVSLIILMVLFFGFAENRWEWNMGCKVIN